MIYLQTKMHNSYMFTDKLYIFTQAIRTLFINQNSNYQPFSVKVGFLPRLDFPTEDIFINKPILRLHSSSYRGGVILIDLNQSSPDTICEHVFPEISRENHFSVFLAVLDEFLLTSVWEKNSDLKNLTKSQTLSL